MNSEIPKAPPALAAITFFVLAANLVGIGTTGYVSPIVYLISLLYLVIFSISFYVTLLFLNSDSDKFTPNIYTSYELTFFSKIIFYISIIIFLITYISVIGFNFSTFLEQRNNIISLYRSEELSASFRFLSSIGLIVFYFSTFLYMTNNKNKYFYAAVALLFPLLMANRNYIVILFIFLIYKILIVEKNKNLAFSFLALFIGINMIYVYAFEKGQEGINIFLGTIYSITNYLTLPLHGLSYSIDAEIDYGYYLSLPLSVVSWLGIYSNREFFYTPYPNQTNVYTLFFGVLYDFGFTGIVVFASIIGSFHAYIYHRAQNSSLFLFLCIFSFYPILMTYFDNTYTTSPGAWLYLLVPFIFLKKVQNSIAGSQAVSRV